MKIIFNKRDPVYVQVIQEFKRMIANEDLIGGQEIPSRRELAGQLGINPNTAQRAYKEMEEDGLIYTESNQPSKITNDINKLSQVRQELIVSAVGQFVEAMNSIRVPLDECLQIVEKEYGKVVE